MRVLGIALRRRGTAAVPLPAGHVRVPCQPAADHGAGGDRHLHHQQDELVREQQIPERHLPVAGPRRHGDPDAPDARAQLQQRDRAEGIPLRREEPGGTGRRAHPHVPAAVRIRRRRRWAHRRADRARQHRRAVRGAAARGAEERACLLRGPAPGAPRAAAERAGHQGVGRRAVSRAPPRHLHQPGVDQGGEPPRRVHAAARRGAGLRARRRDARCGGGRGSARNARRHVEERAAEPVPRHPSGKLHQGRVRRRARADGRGAPRCHAHHPARHGVDCAGGGRRGRSGARRGEAGGVQPGIDGADRDACHRGRRGAGGAGAGTGHPRD